jgi:hypothetical protein
MRMVWRRNGRTAVEGSDKHILEPLEGDVDGTRDRSFWRDGRSALGLLRAFGNPHGEPARGNWKPVKDMKDMKSKARPLRRAFMVTLFIASSIPHTTHHSELGPVRMGCRMAWPGIDIDAWSKRNRGDQAHEELPSGSVGLAGVSQASDLGNYHGSSLQPCTDSRDP